MPREGLRLSDSAHPGYQAVPRGAKVSLKMPAFPDYKMERDSLPIYQYPFFKSQ